MSKYVRTRLVCQQDKVERAKPVGLLEPFHQRAGDFLYVDERAVQRVPGRRSWSFTWTDLSLESDVGRRPGTL